MLTSCWQYKLWTNDQFLVHWLQLSIRIQLLEIQQWVHVSATEYRLLWLQMITISDVVLDSKVDTDTFGNYGLSDAIPYCFSEAIGVICQPTV